MDNKEDLSLQAVLVDNGSLLAEEQLDSADYGVVNLFQQEDFLTDDELAAELAFGEVDALSTKTEAEAMPVSQIFYVNFQAGTALEYNNGKYTCSVEMTSAGYSAEEQTIIIDTLNEMNVQNGILFTVDAPADGRYSTIYVGSTDDFDKYGTFKGLAETIDKGNLIADDEAFVNTKYISSIQETISVIDHEAGHLLGDDHGITGNITDYAANNEGDEFVKYIDENGQEQMLYGWLEQYIVVEPGDSCPESWVSGKYYVIGYDANHDGYINASDAAYAKEYSGNQSAVVDWSDNFVSINNDSVKIILVDGFTLKVGGIEIQQGLTVYGQTGNSGVLDSQTNSVDGIGGNGILIESSYLTICGGTVRAAGYKSEYSEYLEQGGGIVGSNGSLTVTGGVLYAEGRRNYAGINVSTTTITGGLVVASGGANAAGIGTGLNVSTKSWQSISITGGTVIATGGTAMNPDETGGAGIGSGELRGDKDPMIMQVSITGGTVIAEGKDGAAGIGGCCGTAATSITIGNATVQASATGNNPGSAIGSGYGGTASNVQCSADLYGGTSSDMDSMSLLAGTSGAYGEALLGLPYAVTVPISYDERIVVESGTVSLTNGKTYTVEAGADVNGGAAYVSAGKLTGENASFAANIVDEDNDGGAIYNNAQLSLTGGTFSDNCARSGGAIYSSGTSTINDAAFAGNTASANGGAIYNCGSIKLTGGTFTDNSAVSGAAIYNKNSSSLVVTDSVFFSGNTASQNGGAIYNGGRLVLSGGTVNLLTESDTIYNYKYGSTANGEIVFDVMGTIAGGTATGACINNYQYLQNSGGTLKIMVSSNQTAGTYAIATGDFTSTTGKDTFTLVGTNYASKNATLSIGDTTVLDGWLYTLATEESNLNLTMRAAGNTYVIDSGWSSSSTGDEKVVDSTTYYYGLNAFSTNAAAISAGVAGKSVIFVGGTYSSTLEGGGASSVEFRTGDYQKILGGKKLSAASEINGSVTMTIKDGTYSQAIACGDGVSAGVAVTRTGNLTTSISGGTFNGVVAGGMFYCPAAVQIKIQEQPEW